MNRNVSYGVYFLFIGLYLVVNIYGAIGSEKKAAPYVDSGTIKKRFSEITEKDMEELRKKKIIFASRSFGLNLCKGLNHLAKKDKKHGFLNSYKRYDVNKAGGDVSIIPVDIFKQVNFVHFLATYWPHSKRVDEMEKLLDSSPDNFGKTADVVMIYFHTAQPNGFEHYTSKMDAMQKKYPNVKFIYVTAGYMGPKYDKQNELSFKFNEMIRKRYKGKVPLYDLGRILSDDNRVGHKYCPEYSKDPAEVHPNLPLGEEMMAKGFLLILNDVFKSDYKTVLDGTTDKKSAEQKKETLPANHPEMKAVRRILDYNGLKKKNVESIAIVENGHITKLYLQEGGVHTLTDDIAVLKHLELLHLYGDRSLKLPLLKKVSSKIGKCSKLEELLLNQNDLSDLPDGIIALKNLKNLSVGENHLKKISPKVKAWLETYDPKGLKLQN